MKSASASSREEAKDTVGKSHENRMQQRREITQKSTKIRLNVARGRSRPPWVAPGSAGNAPGHTRNGRWTPSWVVLGAMLAVLGAMLAVWDTKLTARGAPRTLRSARGARLCRHSASETRSQRIHTRLVPRKPQFLPCLTPVWAILPRAAVMREKPRKSRRFGFQNRVRGPFERASRAQKRPVRAKKRARSASGASDFFPSARTSSVFEREGASSAPEKRADLGSR